MKPCKLKSTVGSLYTQGSASSYTTNQPGKYLERKISESSKGAKLELDQHQ